MSEAKNKKPSSSKQQAASTTSSPIRIQRELELSLHIERTSVELVRVKVAGRPGKRKSWMGERVESSWSLKSYKGPFPVNVTSACRQLGV